MLAAILGLSSALIFGAADFLGGIASKRMNPVRITAIVAVSGLLPLLVVIAFMNPVWSWQAIWYGGLSGLSGAIAISLLYASLAIGPMSILSPLTAVIAAVVPMTVGLMQGHELASFGYLGLGLALIAVILVGFVPEKGAVRPRVRGLLMATGSGMMIGVFVLLLDLTPDDSGLVPLVMNRAVNAAIMGTVIALLVLRGQRFVRPSFTASDSWWRGPVGIAIVAGFIDAFANVVLLLGLRLGELTVISVLSAMYPAGTIILAAIVLRERIAPVQIVGLVLAIAAAGLLAIA